MLDFLSYFINFVYVSVSFVDAKIYLIFHFANFLQIFFQILLITKPKVQ